MAVNAVIYNKGTRMPLGRSVMEKTRTTEIHADGTRTITTMIKLVDGYVWTSTTYSGVQVLRYKDITETSLGVLSSEYIKGSGKGKVTVYTEKKESLITC